MNTQGGPPAQDAKGILPARIRADLGAIVGDLQPTRALAPQAPETTQTVLGQIEQRNAEIRAQVDASLAGNAQEADQAAAMLLRWMLHGKIVRVLGVGRAALAAFIPANRLAHGGAQAYLRDSVLPIPHTIRGGGIIAISASRGTRRWLATLRLVRQFARDVEILGLGPESAHEFRSLCDIFIGLAPEKDGGYGRGTPADSTLSALSQLLDALVVSAASLGDLDNPRWRLEYFSLPHADWPDLAIE